MIGSNDIVQEVRYENLISITPIKADGRPGAWTGKVAVEFGFLVGNQVDVPLGTKLTLDVTDTKLSGIYPLLEKKRSAQGYEQWILDASALKLPYTRFDWSTMRGRIYFGEVNVLAEQGGLKTFIAKSDAGKVILLLLGAGLMGLAAWFLFND